MVSNVEDIDSCPKCSARLLVFTYEGPDQYLSCVKCSWKIQAKKGVAPKVAKAKKRLSKKNKEPISSESRPKLPDRQPKYNYSAGTQLGKAEILRASTDSAKNNHSKRIAHFETVSCPFCQQVNRLPPNRRVGAKCGKCGKNLFSKLPEREIRQGHKFKHEKEEDSPYMGWFWKALLLYLGWMLFNGVFIEGSLKPMFLFGFGLGGVVIAIWFFISQNNPSSIFYRPSVKTFLFFYVIVSSILFIFALGSNDRQGGGGRPGLIYEGFR